MGAQAFDNVVKGCKTAKEAFNRAVEEAQYDHGHAGYTGTIAEKDTFVVIREPKCASAKEGLELAEKLIEEGDDRVDDKWGPAGCIPCDDGTFVFFGWASS